MIEDEPSQPEGLFGGLVGQASPRASGRVCGHSVMFKGRPVVFDGRPNRPEGLQGGLVGRASP